MAEPKKTMEKKYAEQLQQLGVYRTAFEPEIKLLCQMERELRRIDKAWRAACEQENGKDAKGNVILDYCHPLRAKTEKLRADILTHRDSLGLTPKGFKRLRPENKDTDAAAGDVHPFGELLAEIAAQCRQYE